MSNVRMIELSQFYFFCQRGLGWVGKVHSIRAPHLGSIPAAYRSPLVDILSEGWPSHTVLGWASSSWSWYWLLSRGCNITIKAPIFVSPKKKKKVNFILMLWSYNILNMLNLLWTIVLIFKINRFTLLYIQMF